ncbi:MAG: hypothetical protein SPK32_06755 [Bacteroidaceae bacterium]|nr:hypothetical protein [Bacteroidaceae bacterium]
MAVISRPEWDATDQESDLLTLGRTTITIRPARVKPYTTTTISRNIHIFAEKKNYHPSP